MSMMKRYLTEEEQRRLLAEVGRYASPLARRDAAWIRVLIYSGMRIGEFAQMTVGDAIEALKTGYLFIPREHRKGGRHDHQVLVTDPLRDALRALLAARAEIVGGDHTVPETAPLVLSRKNQAMTVRAYEQRVQHWARAAGLPPGASPHWLRHTRAMNIMRRSTSNDPRGIVQAALGHTSISSTGVYTRPSKEDVERDLQLVDGRRRIRREDLRAEYERRGWA